MHAAPFEYHRPTNLQEAIALLGELGDEAMLIAGGHSLVPLLRMRFAQPQHLIDIRRIASIGRFREEREALIVGAVVTHTAIERSALVRAKMPILAEVAGLIGEPGVRNMGTIGGNLAHADPASDWPAVTLALGADVALAGAQGERRVAAGAFSRGLLATALEPTEMITSIRFPVPPPRTGSAYAKHPLPASRFALCGVAALITLDEAGLISRARIAITGLGQTTARATTAEAALLNQRPEAATIERASAHAPDGLDLIADANGSRAWKAQLARVYTRRAVARALERVP
ncbi:MAG: FAD binding domain-containing protein [Longimicrobiales bacterium]